VILSRQREGFTVRAKFFAVILLIACIAFIGGCASPIEYEEIETPDIADAEDTNTSYPEPHIPSESEAAFIAELNGMGLNWSFSEAQRMVDQNLQAIERNRTYFISSPSSLVLGIIILRTNAGTFWGDNHIHMMFSPNRRPTEDEMNRLQQGSLLTDDEWLLFLEFAGTFLDEEAYVASIAARLIEQLENFPFHYETEYSVAIMDGNRGNVDYRVVLRWNPFLERYVEYEIALTVGLPEVYRELIKEFGENRPW